MCTLKDSRLLPNPHFLFQQVVYSVFSGIFSIFSTVYSVYSTCWNKKCGFHQSLLHLSLVSRLVRQCGPRALDLLSGAARRSRETPKRDYPGTSLRHLLTRARAPSVSLRARIGFFFCCLSPLEVMFSIHLVKERSIQAHPSVIS